MADQRQPDDSHGDPLTRTVASHWDDIEQLASPQQRDRIRGLLAGEAETDPAEARAELIEILLGLLPSGHPLARALQSGMLYSRGPGPGAGTLIQPAGGPPSAPIIGPARDAGLVPVTIYLADESIHEQVEAAVQAMLAAAGMYVESREDPVIGSWSRRMFARDGQSGRPNAMQTAMLLQNVAPLLASLELSRDDAIIHMGELLVVKADGVVHALQLTPAQLRLVKDNPHLLRSPAGIVAALTLDQGTGAASGTTRTLEGAGVTFGRPRFSPAADDDLPPRLELSRLLLTDVIVPFDLEEPPEGCRCTEAMVCMTIDTPGVHALALSVPAAAVGGGGRPEDFLLDTRGGGREKLTWKLTARSELAGLRPHGREVHARLESPLAAERLTGILNATVCYVSRLNEPGPEAAAKPLRFTLDLSGGTVETTPG